MERDGGAGATSASKGKRTLPAKIMTVLALRLSALSLRLSWFVPALTCGREGKAERQRVSTTMKDRSQSTRQKQATHMLELQRRTSEEKAREKTKGQGWGVSSNARGPRLDPDPLESHVPCHSCSS